MTASNRLSFVTALEGYTIKETTTTEQLPNYGNGRGYPISASAQTSANMYPWIAPPPGSYLSTTQNRATTRVNAAGTKKWDTMAYGQLTGSWTWNFMLDYKYLAPLQYVFEDYGCGTGTTIGTDTYYTHTFKKKEGGRVPSFTIRRKILNKMAGGKNYSDEVTELRGCVCRSISFSKAAGASQIAVTMTGFYSDEVMVLGNLETTDYTTYTGRLAEYMCMFVGNTASNETYIANTDNLGIQINNNADPVYNTCSPFARMYYEGLTENEFSTSCYSNNPENYKKRLYSGGFKNNQTGTIKPMAKGLQPVPKILLMSYDKSIHDGGYTDFSTAIAASGYKIEFDITDCVIKSLTWPKADSSAIQDNISSAACKDIQLKITTTATNLTETPYEHTVVSVDPTPASSTTTYTIIYDENGGPAVSDETYTGPLVTAKTLPTCTRTGYTFNGWYDNVGLSGESIATLPVGTTGNKRFYAKWTATSE